MPDPIRIEADFRVKTTGNRCEVAEPMAGDQSAGTPLCLAYADIPQRDGLELALKGGQIGKSKFSALCATATRFPTPECPDVCC